MTDTGDHTHLMLDDELLDHLATEDGAMAVFKEHVTPDLIDQDLKDHREVFSFTMDYVNKYNRAPGAAVLTEEFGLPFEEPQTDIEWLLQQLRKRYIRNLGQDQILKASRTIGEDPEAAIEGLSSGLSLIQQETRSHSHSYSHDDWNTVYQNYRKKVAEGMLHGRTFGFEEIDEIMGGIRGLTYIIGRPKRYKSWFLLKAAVEEFLSGGTVSLWSLELDADEMYERFMCMVASVSWTRFQKGGLTPDEHERMQEAGEIIHKLGGSWNIHAPRGGCTVPEIRQQSRQDQADLVVVDQLSWLRQSDPTKRYDKGHEMVTDLNYELKEATADFPIYIAAQFNRTADSVEEMADLGSIGLSDSIGQIADMVMGLYRNKEMAKNNLIEFGTIASRGFENARFEVKVNLSTESNFDYVTRTDID